MNSYTTDIELGGETRTVELHYEIEEDGIPFIYSAQMVFRICKEDEIWYDHTGHANQGPHDLKVSITELLSANQLQFYANEIQQDLLERTVDYSREEALIENWFRSHKAA